MLLVMVLVMVLEMVVVMVLVMVLVLVLVVMVVACRLIVFLLAVLVAWFLVTAKLAGVSVFFLLFFSCSSCMSSPSSILSVAESGRWTGVIMACKERLESELYSLLSSESPGTPQS